MQMTGGGCFSTVNLHSLLDNVAADAMPGLWARPCRKLCVSCVIQILPFDADPVLFIPTLHTPVTALNKGINAAVDD